MIWWDESPLWLAATAASLQKAQVSHLVAVDGAFEHYPGGRTWSGTEQHQALIETCNGLGIGLTVHVPPRLWVNEPEKRTYAFRLAEQIAEPHRDWYLVIDADTVVTEASPFLHKELEEPGFDVAEVTLWERHDPHATPQTEQVAQEFEWDRVSQHGLRALFRAIPGLSVGPEHYMYRTPDSRYLWGHPDKQSLEAAAQLSQSLKLEHRQKFRDLARNNQREHYYRLRRELELEA